jgi:hypothetical protein
MDRITAQSKVRETLQNPFDKNRFIDLVKNLLNKVDESKAFQCNAQYVKEIYREYVKSYERIATYTDPNDKKIDILIVYLQKETSLEKARTAQRNFAAKYLKDRAEKDAGLIAFVSPNLDDWRFSFVKMEYKFTEGPCGKTKVKEEFTPAKRYSFLVGKYENSHTAQSRIVPVLIELKTNPLLEEIEDIFSVEKVTKEFFEKYRELFIELKDEIDKIVKKDHKIKKDFDDKGIEAPDFAKKLLGQIVFLYFLQKKGWFGVNKGMDWGSGSKRFLRDLFDKKIIPYKNFFNDILEPLFYDALARDRSDIDHYNEHFKTKIPFLNGGLFDPLNNYDWVNSDIEIDNILFSNNEKTKQGDVGTGILDVFDRYNFTVKEDEPLEKEVAVDPEMLGKVFENLLEVKDRKSKGTYYTPREIVHYMCEQSLINYLATELEGKASKDDIEKLIKHGEALGENEARVENKGEETSTYSYKLPESIRTNAKLIDQKLAEIKVCDPAIGSGAFPVGMMSEIVKARNVLSSYIKGPGRTIYNFKRDCIQNSLYGVDIDPSAVDIAKLRLWLSLVVDEEDIKQIKPLPNLDYKIMQGNSLLEEFEGIKLFDEKLFMPSAPSFDRQKRIDDLKSTQAELQRQYIKLHSTGKLTKEKGLAIEAEIKKITSQLKQLVDQPKAKEEPGLFASISEARKKADELKLLHKQYFDASHKDEKDKIRKQIDALEWDLIETTLREQGKGSALKKIEEFKKAKIRPFFLWKLHFAEVFQEKGGFDVVIANPPYIRAEDLGDLKKHLKIAYAVFVPGGDIFSYFYEKSFNILATQGVFCFINNAFDKTTAGKALREYVANNCSLQKYIDLKTVGVFEGTTTYPIILLATKSKPQETFEYLKANEATFGSWNLNGELVYTVLSRSSLNQYSWSFNDQGQAALSEKISKYEKLRNIFGKCYRGIITGMNDAFVTERDLGNNNHLKPVFEGKDIKKWLTPAIGKKMIVFENKSTRMIYTGRDEAKAFETMRKAFPMIMKHLEPFAGAARKRYDKGEYWWELRNCAYYDLFAKPKIIFPNLQSSNKFAFDISGIYLNAPAVFLPTDAKWLLGLLNSKVVWYFLKTICVLRSGGFIEVKPQYFEQIPIPPIKDTDKKNLNSLVDQIISAKKKDPIADTRAFEKQIDQMVYKLYGLTDEEIKAVEGEKA